MIIPILRSSLKFFLLLVSVLIWQSAFCWGVTGHRVVAEIAQRHLSKNAKKELTRLIGKESLALWANWADFIRSDTTHAWDSATSWHYVDLPGNMDKPAFIKALKNLPGKTLYTQTQLMIAQLKDKSLSIEKKQIALRFLVHFIGDLHQPLHVGRPGDQGGNKISVFWFDKKTNLHTIWDSELINFQQYSYTEYTTQLDIVSKDQELAWQQSTLEDWFYESHLLADKIYSLSPPEAKLSYVYNYIFQKDLDNQLLKGGLRLAGILNEVWK